MQCSDWSINKTNLWRIYPAIHLVLLGIEDQVDEGHEVSLVWPNVGSIGAGAHAVE